MIYHVWVHDLPTWVYDLPFLTLWWTYFWSAYFCGKKKIYRKKTLEGLILWYTLPWGVFTTDQNPSLRRIERFFLLNRMIWLVQSYDLPIFMFFLYLVLSFCLLYIYIDVHIFIFIFSLLCFDYDEMFLVIEHNLLVLKTQNKKGKTRNMERHKNVELKVKDDKQKKSFGWN